MTCYFDPDKALEMCGKIVQAEWLADACLAYTLQDCNWLGIAMKENRIDAGFQGKAPLEEREVCAQLAAYLLTHAESLCRELKALRELESACRDRSPTALSGDQFDAIHALDALRATKGE